MKTQKISLLLGLLLVIAFFFYSFFLIQHAEYYDTDVNITFSNMSGFNLDKDKLHFGDVGMGSSAFRNMDFSNPYSYPLKVSISSTGNISPFLHYPSVFYLDAGENKTIRYLFAPNSNMDIGDYYTGSIKIVFRRLSFLDQFYLWFLEKEKLL
ncbi:hypothetical protein HZA98_02570 [Candidatus Woesearchaeota archaeon]|nr:hypothetical protein [Candidatus Woesearchaeota archaeon]